MHTSPELNQKPTKDPEVYNPSDGFDKDLGAAALRKMLADANQGVADTID